MPTSSHRFGRVSPMLVLALSSLLLLAGLFWMLRQEAESNVEKLTMFCAAGMRKPIKEIAAQYEKEHGVRVQIQYGGSNTLLSTIEVAKSGDLYLAADDTYTDQAIEKGLVKETLPLAKMKPVIAVQKGNPKNISSIDDLLQDGVHVALGNPDQAAVGKATRKCLQATEQWEQLEKHVKDNGVFKPTVPEIANDVIVGSVDAAIVWDAVAAQLDELEPIAVAALDASEVDITLGVMTTATDSVAALRFARYVAARDKGLEIFAKHGYRPTAGDVWAEKPEVNFYAGAVNRRALEPVIEKFEKREGVTVNTKYNGCGILTGEMRTIIDQSQGAGFPDMFMACDVYYLDTVADLFHDGVNVSNTDIVIVVQKGNPKNIQSLEDLTRSGVRLTIGQPEQCTIGVLTKKLLEEEGLYQQLIDGGNVVTQSPSSALLVPNITTGAADAALAYKTDTLAEKDRLDVISIDSELAQAVQPYSVALSSKNKRLAQRLFDTIAESRGDFESAGFNWRLNSDGPFNID